MLECDAVKIGVSFGYGVITDDEGNFASEFAIALAVEQIHQAMVEFGNKNGNARPVAGNRESPVHGKLLRDRSKLGRKVFQFELEIGEIPFHAGKVKTFFASLVLLENAKYPSCRKMKLAMAASSPF